MDAETAYLFTHGLLRDAAYELQLPEQRARLHLLAADVLELASESAVSSAAEVAHHLAHAREHDTDPALRQREIEKTRQAAEWAEKQFNHAETIRLWRRVSEISHGGDAAQAMRLAGRAAIYSGRSELAESLLARAGEMATACGDKKVQASVLGGLANLFSQTGRLNEARVCHEKALALHREMGNRIMEGSELGNLANLHSRSRRYEEAEQLYGQAIAVHREVGNRLGEGVTLSNLAAAYAAKEKYGEAEAAYLAALTILDAATDRRSRGIALCNLASLYRATDRIPHAYETNLDALAIVRETGNTRYEGIVLGQLAHLDGSAGHLPQALERYRLALAIHSEVRNFVGLASDSCDYGLFLMRAGQMAEGSRQWLEGVALFRSLGDAVAIELKRTEMLAACATAGIPPLDAAGQQDAGAPGLHTSQG